MDYQTFSLIFGFIVSLIILYLNYISFRDNEETNNIIVLAAFFLFLWVGIDFGGFLSGNLNVSKITSKLATICFSTSLYLYHYFYDYISASYKQRKTMTLASVIYGGIVGVTLVNGSLVVTTDNLVIMHPILAILFVIQGTLLLHRILIHLDTQRSLSNHYSIKSIFKVEFTRFAQLLTIIFFLISCLLILIQKVIYVTPFKIILPIAFLFIAIISFKDPLSSMIISQPIQVIALISENGIKHIKILSSTGKSIVEDEDFVGFINEISRLFKEIVKSESRIQSLSTDDILVMFESCGQDILIMILNYNTPLIRKLLHKISQEIIANKIIDDKGFNTVVDRILLSRPAKHTLRFVDRNDFVIVYNDKSAKIKNTIRSWNKFFNSYLKVKISDFNVSWLNKNHYSHIIIMGGDGSIHSVVNEIMKSKIEDIAIGIIPSGGGNDIFKRWNRLHNETTDLYLDMPLLEIKFKDKLIFGVNTIEWGIGAPTAEKRENNEGKLLFGKLKYFYLVIKSLPKYSPWRSKIVIDKKNYDYEKLSALLLSFGSSQLGGGYVLFPEEIKNDPNGLYMFTGENYGKLKGLRLFFKLATGNHFKEKNIKKFSIKESVILEPQEDTVVLTIDGELTLKPPAQIKRSDKKIKTFLVQLP